MFRQDLDSLTPTRDFTRRAFVQTSVGSGFAAAVLPVSAQTVVKTDTQGLVAGPVSIPVGGFELPAYRAAPEGKRHPPVVLVLSEIFGVHEHIADVARRFAKLGYLALAPDLFVRQGDPQKVSSIADLQKDIISKTRDAQVMADLDAVVAWAKANGGDGDKIAITGFCWGGRITWLYAAHNPSIKAGVAWYGRLMGESNANFPRHPVDIAGALTVPVLGLYGLKDTGISQESIEIMKAALAKGPNKSTFVIYPNSGHAFHADYRPSYVEADAKDGWGRMQAWFKQNGVF